MGRTSTVTDRARAAGSGEPLGGRVAGFLRLWERLGTDQVQWVGLFATLWLRASFLIAAPALASVSESPYLSGSYDLRGFRDGIWAAAAVWAAGTAVCAPLIVPRMLRSHGRARFPLILVRGEVLVAGLVLVCIPSWPTAAFATGVLNLLQRPIWKTWRLAVFAVAASALFTVGVLINHHRWSVEGAIIEAVAGAAVLAAISYCYGLVLPAFVRVAMVHPAFLWMRRRAHRRRIEAFALGEAGAAVDEAERVFEEILSTNKGDEVLREAAATLALARVALATPSSDRRRRRSYQLDDTLKAAIFSIVPPIGDKDDEHMHGYEPTIYPPQLRYAVLSKTNERALKDAVSEIAREAKDHGTGRLKTEVRVEGDSIVVAMANEIGARRPKGRSHGGLLIDEAVGRLPNGSVSCRQQEEHSRFFGGERAFVVKFRFSIGALDRAEAARAVLAR